MRPSVIQGSVVSTKFCFFLQGDYNLKFESAFIEHIRVSVSDMDIMLDGIILGLQEVDSSDSAPQIGGQDVNCISSLPCFEGDNDGLQEGIHVIHEFIQYLRNGLSLTCTDIILSLHTLASEEIKCRLQGISIQKSISSERQCSISNLDIQVLKDEQTQLLLKMHCEMINIQLELENKCFSRVSCSTLRPISCIAVPVALSTVQSVIQMFLNKVHKEEGGKHNASKDSEACLEISVLKELNLPLVGEVDHSGADSMGGYGFYSVADDDVDQDRLASSVADIVSTMFFSTQQIAEEEALDAVRELSSLYCFYIRQVVVKTLPEHKMQVHTFTRKILRIINRFFFIAACSCSQT